MLSSTEVDAVHDIVLPNYDSQGLDDGGTLIQPSLLQDHCFDWPPPEYLLPDGDFGDGDLTCPDSELWLTGGRNAYQRQSSSGTETSVTLLDGAPEVCLDVGNNELHPQLKERRSHSLHDMCIFDVSGVTPCFDDGFETSIVRSLHSAPLHIRWDDGEHSHKRVKQEFPTPEHRYPDMAWRNRFGGLHDVSPREALSDRYNQYLSMRPQLQQSSNRKPKMAAGVPIPPRRLSPEKNLIRKAKVARYLEKRKRRTWGHKIRYASRKAYAENRPRIKGRFAKQADFDALKLKEQKFKK